MTTAQRGLADASPGNISGKTGEIAIDQLRAVDKTRLVKRLGKLDRATATAVSDTLGELFAP